MTTLYIIFLFFAPSLCQFVVDFGMKPDVKFGEQNERFDVQSIIQDQSRMDIGNPTDDFRRLMDVIKKNNEKKDSEDKKAKEIDRNDREDDNQEDDKNEEIDKREELIDAVKDTVSNLGVNNFAYHSNLDSGPDDDDYEKNLAAFEGKRRNFRKMVDLLERINSGRRSFPDTEDEVLFNNGVPVNMKIQGFLEVPLEEER